MHQTHPPSHPLSHMDKLWTLTVGLLGSYTRLAKQHGITDSELMVWYALHVLGQCTQKQICDDWRLPKQTVFSICKRLVKTGFVVMSGHDGDKRQKTLSLTDAGRQRAERLIAPLLALEAQTAAAFGDARFSTLLAELGELVHLYQANVIDFKQVN